MNRRKLLGWLGLAPMVAALPAIFRGTRRDPFLAFDLDGPWTVPGDFSGANTIQCVHRWPMVAIDDRAPMVVTARAPRDPAEPPFHKG